VPLIYTAESQALAVLEILVLDEPLRARYVVIPGHIPDDLAIEQVRIDQLPPDWRSPDARGELQKLGAAWVQRGIKQYAGRRDWTRTNDPHHVKVVL
jgi:hypothetical protein